jgi:hypothetical protein
MLKNRCLLAWCANQIHQTTSQSRLASQSKTKMEILRAAGPLMPLSNTIHRRTQQAVIIRIVLLNFSSVFCWALP